MTTKERERKQARRKLARPLDLPARNTWPHHPIISRHHHFNINSVSSSHHHHRRHRHHLTPPCSATLILLSTLSPNQIQNTHKIKIKNFKKLRAPKPSKTLNPQFDCGARWGRFLNPRLELSPNNLSFNHTHPKPFKEFPQFDPQMPQSQSHSHAHCVSNMFHSHFIVTFSLLLSLPIIFLLAPRLLPPRCIPISLPDELDDLALFNRAIVAASNPYNKPRSASIFRLGATNPRLKIAFMFLTNSDLWFSPIWERFFNGSSKDLYNVYVHADPDCNVRDPGGVFEGKFIASKHTERASPTLISAARRLLATAILDDSMNFYFALVSQHCVPIHSFRYMYDSVFQRGKRFIWVGKVKYRSFIEILSNESTLNDRYYARGDNVMLPEVPYDEFRVGSQFFVLNKKHALMVLRDRKLWRKFRLPCINIESCYPEEHYFPTLLSMQDLKGCTQFMLTRVNWTDSVDGHPHIYRPPEVTPELIYELRQSNFTYDYMFARKFSPDCLNVLMDMADSVIFKD